MISKRWNSYGESLRLSVILLDNPGSWQPEGASKISFTFHSGHKSFILDDVQLAELSNDIIEWKNMTFLGVGSKHILWPYIFCYIFSGVKTPNTSRTYAPGKPYLHPTAFVNAERQYRVTASETRMQDSQLDVAVA